MLSRWFLGLLFTVLIAGLNQFFSFRCRCSLASFKRPLGLLIYHANHAFHYYALSFTSPVPCTDPAVTITALIAQVLSLPLGRLFQYTLPTTVFRLFGHEVSLAFLCVRGKLLQDLLRLALDSPFTAVHSLTFDELPFSPFHFHLPTAHLHVPVPAFARPLALDLQPPDVAAVAGALSPVNDEFTAPIIRQLSLPSE